MVDKNQTASSSKIANYLADHPKMTGVIFSILLALGQAGSVVAGQGSSYPGP